MTAAYKSRTGIPLAEYDALLAAQGGGCAICGNAPKTRRLHVDHDHKTGAVRGVLCFNCNQALGNSRDDVIVLQRLITYLRPWWLRGMPPTDSVIERALRDLLAAA